MPYDRYRDSNGITWQVHPPVGWTMYAYIPDDTSPTYDPLPADLTSATPPPSDIGAGVPDPTGDQQRVIFADLVRQIEAYAAANRTATAVKVKASAGVPWWVWALGAMALLSSKRR